MSIKQLITNFVGSIITAYKGDCMDSIETEAVMIIYPVVNRRSIVRIYKLPVDEPVGIGIYVDGTLSPHDAINLSMGILRAAEYAIELQNKRKSITNFKKECGK